MLVSKNVLPFMGVEFDQTVGNFRVITYQAYNAMGLIGPEKNGIAVLNETEQNVLLDEYCKQSSGYFGMSKIFDKAKQLCDMIENNFDAFVELVNTNPRSRYEI